MLDYILAKKCSFLIIRIIGIVIDTRDESDLIDNGLNAGHVAPMVIDQDNVVGTGMLCEADAGKSKSFAC